MIASFRRRRTNDADRVFRPAQLGNQIHQQASTRLLEAILQFAYRTTSKSLLAPAVNAMNKSLDRYKRMEREASWGFVFLWDVLEQPFPAVTGTTSMACSTKVSCLLRWLYQC